MSERETKPVPKSTAANALSRRRLLGGALAGTLAAVLIRGEQAHGHRGPDRWAGKTRWIGHC